MASTYDEILKRLQARALDRAPVAVPAATSTGLMSQRAGVTTPKTQAEEPVSSMDYLVNFISDLADKSVNFGGLW